MFPKRRPQTAAPPEGRVCSTHWADPAATSRPTARGQGGSDPLERRALARLAAVLLVGCGVVVVTTSPLLPQSAAARLPGIEAAGAAAVAIGVCTWLLPWQRWSRRALYALPVLALIVIAVFNAASAMNGYRYALFYMLTFVWIGLALPPGGSVRLTPALIASYLSPLRFAGRGWDPATSSVLFVVAACVAAGEALAWVSERLRIAHATLSDSEAMLRDERHFLQQLVAALNDGLVACDAAGAVQLVNPSAATLLARDARVDLGHWAKAASLRSEDGSRLAADQLPLARAARGECVTDLPLTVSAAGDPRFLLVSARPIIAGQARPMGALMTLRDVTDQRKAEIALVHQSLHDPLTGLPNRNLLVDHLSVALRRLEDHPGCVAVLFIDLDNFKVINDSLGHAAGDTVLRAVAEHLRAAAHPDWTVARFGGDEFVVVCPDLTEGSQAVQVAGRLCAALQRPIYLSAGHTDVGASVGAAVTSSDQANPADLLRDADAALYRAKEMGRGRCEVFDAQLRAQMLRRYELQTDLQGALGNDALRIHYQPEVLLGGGLTVGFEALLRWQHPVYGLMGPDDFVPIAEETGLILPIGAWVLDQACRQARAWNARWSGGNGVVMSVNVSARQLADPRLVALVASTLEKTALDPAHLCLEVTESVAMEEGSILALRHLKALGLRIAVDDFGTGYASLTYLKRLPLDVLKIDRLFVQRIASEPADRAIVSAVASMARDLGLDVVAEGVETDDQAALLGQLRCTMAQGFHFSRPLPPEEIERRVQRTAAGHLTYPNFTPYALGVGSEKDGPPMAPGDGDA